MNYLFETEHFLLRKKIPGDNCLLPEAFPDHAAVRFVLKEELCRMADTTNMLVIESRYTGTPVGEIMVRDPADVPGKAEAFCCLYKKFQKKCFQEEIISALSS